MSKSVCDSVRIEAGQRGREITPLLSAWPFSLFSLYTRRGRGTIGKYTGFSIPKTVFCWDRWGKGGPQEKGDEDTALGFQPRQSFADGVFGQFGDAVNVQLAHDFPALGLDRLDGPVQAGGDLAGGFAFRQQL